MKPPSDTSTKLIDYIEEHLGIHSPWTIVTARLLAIAAVAMHRSNQMLTAKEDLGKYKSLYGYRHAANQRFSMPSSLGKLISFAEKELFHLKPRLQVSSLPSQLIPPNTPPRRATHAQDDTMDRVQWGFTGQQGCTPCRGRAVNPLHISREQTCDGRVLILKVNNPADANDPKDKRQPCRLCKSKTAFYCTGCKNYLCFGTQSMDAKKANAVIASQQAAGQAAERPKFFLKIPYYNEKKKQWTYYFASNCCYNVLHRSSFNGKDWISECSGETPLSLASVNQTFFGASL